MVMAIFWKKTNTCAHLSVHHDKDSGYCSDCGEFVENKWYLARCRCCKIKRKSVLSYNTLKPASKFCPNCGATDFTVEELKNINFIDIKFAVLIKETVPTRVFSNYSQIWVEKKHESSPMLLEVFQ